MSLAPPPSTGSGWEEGAQTAQGFLGTSVSIHLLFPTAFPCSSASCQGLSAPDTNLGPLVFGCWGESLPLQKQKSYGCCEQDATTGIAKGAKTKTQCHHDVSQQKKRI